MSDIEKTAPLTPIVAKRPRKPRAESDKTDKPERRTRAPTTKNVNEVVEFRKWLAALDLGIIPTVHVNGAPFTNCILAVDFGNPLKGIKFTPEQSVELVTRIRGATKSILDRDIKISVMSDHANGVWWTSVP